MKLQYKGLVMMFAFAVSALMTSCNTDKRPLLDDESSLQDKDIYDVTLDIDCGGLDIGGGNGDGSGSGDDGSGDGSGNNGDVNYSRYTLIFYPTDGSESSTFVVDADEPKITIKKGEYSVIIFNGTYDSHDNITFNDIDAYETIKACSEGLEYVDTSSCLLYTDSKDLINITSTETTIKFKLSDSMSILHVTAYISSLNKLASEGNVVKISGLSNGLYLYNREPVESEVMSVNVNMPILVFNDNSNTNGYIRGQAKCFGLYSSEEVTPVNTASLILLSKENTYYEIDRDISGAINEVADANVLSVDIPGIVL